MRALAFLALRCAAPPRRVLLRALTGDGENVHAAWTKEDDWKLWKHRDDADVDEHSDDPTHLPIDDAGAGSSAECLVFEMWAQARACGG